MAKIDPEQERKRLAEFYSRQLDGRLEKVAGEAYELSDLAKEMLRAELKKRGLNVELTEQVPIVEKASEPRDLPKEPAAETTRAEVEPMTSNDQAEIQNMMAIRWFRDLPEALLAKGSLDSAEIDCTLVDDNIVRMDWLCSNAMRGIKLLVNAGDAVEAVQILSQPIPEHIDVPGIGDFEQPKCPNCGSLDIGFREIQPAAYLSMALSVPIPFRKQAWHCHSCDKEWEDDGVVDSTESAT